MKAHAALLTPYSSIYRLIFSRTLYRAALLSAILLRFHCFPPSNWREYLDA